MESFQYKMAAIYRDKWSAGITSPEQKKAIQSVWISGLTNAGLTADQIQHGIDRAAVECEWPPSISEFISLALDIPSLAQFLAGDNKLDLLVCSYCELTEYDLAQFTIKEKTQWRKDMYPLLVEILRKSK